jgi:cephalosporin-C deacetylase-like acetyl esterase
MALVNAEYGQMDRSHLIVQTRALAAARQQRLASLRSPADCERYIAAARQATHEAFGLLPERTALNAVTVSGPQHFEGYRVENIRFESMPGNFVTANLYLPATCSAASPAPAVLQPLGHSATAKAATGYQVASQRLVLAGFAVLTYDPINQGERDQYTTLLPDEEPVLGSCSPGSARTSTACHNMMGKQLELCGDWFGRWMLWDGIRAVDYLESRAEIDTSTLGLTGCS